MARRPRRASARRLRDASRAALRGDLRSDQSRGWRKPLVIHADWSRAPWLEGAVLFGGGAGFLITRLQWAGALGITAFWLVRATRRLTQRPTMELSRAGVRLLRVRPPRTIPWARIGGVEDSVKGMTITELRPGQADLLHTALGVPQTQRFRASAVIRGQAAANIFD